MLEYYDIFSKVLFYKFTVIIKQRVFCISYSLQLVVG